MANNRGVTLAWERIPVKVPWTELMRMRKSMANPADSTGQRLEFGVQHKFSGAK